MGRYGPAVFGKCLLVICSIKLTIYNANGNPVQNLFSRSVVDLHRNIQMFKSTTLNGAHLSRNSDYLCKFCFYLQQKNYSLALKKTFGGELTRISILRIRILMLLDYKVVFGYCGKRQLIGYSVQFLMQGVWI